MCFPPTSKAECSNEEVYDLFIDNAKRTEVENQLRLVNGFLQLPIKGVELEIVVEHQQQNEQQSQITNTIYGFANALASFATTLAQFDELNPHFFDDGDISIVLPSVHIEL